MYNETIQSPETIFEFGLSLLSEFLVVVVCVCVGGAVRVYQGRNREMSILSLQCVISGRAKVNSTVWKNLQYP